MDTCNRPRRLLETEHVDWTRDKLERRIAETRSLLERIGTLPEDQDLAWIRGMLETDLTRKRALLDELDALELQTAETGS